MAANRPALLVMDMQQGIVDRYASSEEHLKPFQQAIAAARQAGFPVIFVRVAFRAGYPEVSQNNKSFSAISQRPGFAMDAEATHIHPALAPASDEVIVTKLRVSAFAGSDLDVILRARQIDTLVLTGIATSGVVLSTLRQAADLDFRLTVLSDACIDADEEVHRVLTEKVFPRQADVMTVEQWTAQIGRN